MRWCAVISVVMTGIMQLTAATAGAAQHAVLGQTVNPITCVYTIIASDNEVSSSTACDSVIPATLDVVEPRAGRPLLRGTVTTVSLASLHVAVGDLWFTLGVGNDLVASNGVWTLDMSMLETPLSAGSYTVVLEERTTTDFLLRSVYEDVLTVPIVEVTHTDTSDGDSITSHTIFDAQQQGVASIGTYGFDLLSTVPSQRTTDGIQIYTTDTFDSSQRSHRIASSIYWLAAMVAFGYILYLAYRVFIEKYKR